MIVAIFFLAIILLLAGLAGLISAINLVPTDLGFTYFQAGTTALSAGIVVLALGFAVKVLNRSLQRLAVPEPVRVAPADPVIDLPPLPASEPELMSGAGNLASGSQSASNLTPAIAVAGAAAVAAAGAIAATGLSHAATPEMTEAANPRTPVEDGNAIVDELERDLFAQIEAVHAESLPDLKLPDVTLPDDVTFSDEAHLPAPPPASKREDAYEARNAPEGERAEQLAGDFTFPLPEFALPPALDVQREDWELSTKNAGVEPELTGPLGTVPAEKSEEEHLPLDPVSPRPPFFASRRADAVEDQPPVKPYEVVEPVDAGTAASPPSEATTPAPGLIHDADFAAVSDQAMPPLAPISSLEVIGAYDSGGTRFTMYSDGSVVAVGPEGERRFRSLDELRRHIDGGLT